MNRFFSGSFIAIASFILFVENCRADGELVLSPPPLPQAVKNDPLSAYPQSPGHGFAGGFGGGFPGGEFPPGVPSPYPGLGGYPMGADPSLLSVPGSSYPLVNSYFNGSIPGNRPPVESRAYLNNVEGCPFTRNKSDSANALIAGVVNALSDLQTKCPALSQSIQNFQNQANHMYDLTQAPGSYMQGGSTVQVTCMNFEFALRNEYDFVSSHPGSMSDISRYRTCSIVDAASRAKCIDSSYADSLSSMAYQCKTNFNSAAQEQLKQGLQAFANQASALIQQSDHCGTSSELMQIIANIGINSLSTIASVAPAAGLTGAALGMGGQLLNALVNKFFSKNAPQQGIKALYNENEAENLSCLWFALQNRTLNCVQMNANTQTLRQPELACYQPLNGVFGPGSMTVLEQLDQTMLVVAVSANGSSAEKLLDQLQAPVENPNGTGGQKIPLRDHLTEMRDVLSRSGGAQNQQYAAELDAFLISASKLADAVARLQTLPVDQRAELLKTATKGVQSSILFRISDVAKAYWQLKGDGGQFDRLRSYNDTRDLLERGYTLALSAKHDASSPDDYQQDLAIASNYMVQNFQSYFTDRLKSLNDRYERNKDANDVAQQTSDLLPIFKTCSQLAGMYYAKPVGNPAVDRSLNQIRGAGAGEYQKACSRFACSKDSKVFSFFDPSTALGPNLPQKFRNYQCSAVSSYSFDRDRFLENMQQSGKPCGN